MKTVYHLFFCKFIQSGICLIIPLLVYLVLGGCVDNNSKIVKIDQENGAIKGTLKPVPNGTVVILCHPLQTSCVPLPEFSDKVNRRGEFVISLIPPGFYIIAYVFPKDLIDGKINITKGDTLIYTFGNNINLEAKLMEDGKWHLDKEASSETHLIDAGAELSISSEMGLDIKNCSVKHKASGLWMEYREGYRYESIEIEPNKVVELNLNRYVQD